MNSTITLFVLLSLIFCMLSCGTKEKSPESTDVNDEIVNEMVEEENSPEIEPVENKVLNNIVASEWILVDGVNFEPVEDAKKVKLSTKDDDGFYYYEENVICDFQNSINSENGVYFRTLCDEDFVFLCIDICLIEDNILEFSYWDQCARIDDDAGNDYYKKVE